MKWNYFNFGLLLATLTEGMDKIKSNLPILYQVEQPTSNVIVFRGSDQVSLAHEAGLIKNFHRKIPHDGIIKPIITTKTAKPNPIRPLITTTTTTAPPPPTSKSIPKYPKSNRRNFSAQQPRSYRPNNTKSYPLFPKPLKSYQPPPQTSYKNALPLKYDWEYSVNDEYNNFGHKESRDGDVTRGKYYVTLPDGRLQTVTYTVDAINGYVPVIEYS